MIHLLESNQPSETSAMGLILGGTGQIGRALAQLAPSAQVWGRTQADFLAPSSWLSKIADLKPAWVINANAYTAVDLAEKPEEFERALQVNARTPALISAECARLGIPFVHYSTDYVYPGADYGTRPWSESDATGPLNHYGRTKLEGDQAIAKGSGKWLIFRTSWVYDETGKNFLNTMLRLGSERPELRVVADQIGAPSYATDLARATLDALEQAMSRAEFPSGIYHLCNSGEASWASFAQEIFNQAHLPTRVVEIPSSDYPTPAKRPLNSRMSLEKLERTFGIQMPHWQDGLKRCLSNKFQSHPSGISSP